MDTIQKILDKIIQTYPFLNDQELNTFSKAAKEIASNKDYSELDAIKNILKLLSNNHADIKVVSSGGIKFEKPSYVLENNLLIVTIPSWSKSQGDFSDGLIKMCCDNVDKCKAVILDVRENQGGDSTIAHKFASIFFNKPVSYGKFVRRINNQIVSSQGILNPHKSIFIDKPLAILISKKCYSSNELFIAPFKISKRAVLIGQKTAGGSGNPVSENITIDNIQYRVRIPTWRFFLEGSDKPIEETVIIPDIECDSSQAMEIAVRYFTDKIK
jgi:C-terminal processing protease CtpA/Prc